MSEQFRSLQVRKPLPGLQQVELFVSVSLFVWLPRVLEVNPQSKPLHGEAQLVSRVGTGAHVHGWGQAHMFMCSSVLPPHPGSGGRTEKTTSGPPTTNRATTKKTWRRTVRAENAGKK